MPNKFNELLLKQDIIELYNTGITPDYGYLMNGRFEKDMIKTMYPLKTLSGNPITWEASDTEYLFPVVSLEPKQAGSGDPSPENVRPISGYDGVTVDVRGKNLLDYSGEIIIPQNRYQYIYDDEEFITALNRLPRNTPLVMSANWSYISETKVYKRISVVYHDKTYTNFNDGASATIEDKEIIITWLYAGDNKTQDCIVSDIQFELGSTPTPYEPYLGDTYDIALPETVYGGTVDAVSGVGSEEWRPVLVLDSTSLIGYLDELSNDTTCLFYISNITNQENYLYFCCSHLPAKYITNTSTTEIGISGNPQGNTLYMRLPRTTASNISEFKGWLDEQKTAGTPVQVTYKLATPEPFQATGNQQLTSLFGYNTMYTDGDSMVLSRKARRLEV